MMSGQCSKNPYDMNHEILIVSGSGMMLSWLLVHNPSIWLGSLSSLTANNQTLELVTQKKIWRTIFWRGHEANHHLGDYVLELVPFASWPSKSKSWLSQCYSHVLIYLPVIQFHVRIGVSLDPCFAHTS